MAKAVKAVGTAIMIVGAVVATGGMALAMGAGVCWVRPASRPVLSCRWGVSASRPEPCFRSALSCRASAALRLP